MLPRAEYISNFGQDFLSKCSFSFAIELSVFFILASIVVGSASLAFRFFALVLSTFLPLALGFGGW